MAAPLDRWRVVDLTDLRGALCGRILADLGADVVQVLRPPSGEGPDPRGATTEWRYRQANKRGLVLDPTAPSGRARLDDLLAGADVLVDNLDPATRAAIALEPDRVAAAHPHLVHAAIADFGLSGPRSGWALDPLTAQAAGGTLYASGFAELPPCWMPGYLGFDAASISATAGVVAAVMDRRRHGRGQLVEVSVQEATLAGTNPWSVAIKDYLKINPHLPARGSRNADGSYWVLPASDGWVRAVIGNNKQWQGFLRLLRRPEVLSGPEWEETLFRRMNADVVRLVAGELLADRTRAELFAAAYEVGATLGVVHMPSEFVAHPQTRARAVFAVSGHPGLGDAPFARPPLRMSATPGGLRRAAPDPGRPEPVPDWTAPGAASDGPAGPRAGSTVADGGPTRALLDGVLVVEFGMAAVGPEAALVLSELGADVVKIESRAHPDVLRASGLDRVNCAFAFNTECRGRRSVALDLGTATGRGLAFELCRRADVVVENFRGAVLDRMGLGYEAVAAANPAVVYASSQGYGRGGPLDEMPAYGPLNLGFVGQHHLWNHPDAPYPCGTSLNHPDHVAGKMLAVGILAALDHRDRTGEGQRVEMAQIDFAAFLRGEVYLDAHLAGRDPVATGNASATACPHGVYRCAGDDGWVAVVAGDDRAWLALCRATGWGDDPGLRTLGGRRARAGEIDAMLSAWTAPRSKEQAAAELQAAGVTAAPVMGPLDHLDDPHLLERGYIVTLEHPEVGSERHAGNPVRLSLTPQRVAASAPCLGADTEEVLETVLGLPAGEVAALVASGVCR